MEFGEGKVQTILNMEEKENNASISKMKKNEKKIIMPNKDVTKV